MVIVTVQLVITDVEVYMESVWKVVYRAYVLGNVRGMDEVAVDSGGIFVSVTADWLYGQGLNACTSRMIELITRVPIK